jgi:hypothetical protein
MKVKDIIAKCRLRDTSIVFLENGKVIEESVMSKLYIKEEPPIMLRTLNSWEIKDNKFIIWVKPE